MADMAVDTAGAVTTNGGSDPLVLEPKQTVLARLASRGVRGLNFWSVPHPALPPLPAKFSGALVHSRRAAEK